MSLLKSITRLGISWPAEYSYLPADRNWDYQFSFLRGPRGGISKTPYGHRALVMETAANCDCELGGGEDGGTLYYAVVEAVIAMREEIQ